MNDIVRIECLECGMQHYIQQGEKYPLEPGDYLEIECPDCDEEKEHVVVRVECKNAD